MFREDEVLMFILIFESFGLLKLAIVNLVMYCIDFEKKNKNKNESIFIFLE